MKYVHFWHFNKQWFAKVNDNPDTERIYPCNESSTTTYDLWKEYLVSESSFLTQRQIKIKLKELYPEHIIIKDRTYHEGHRWFGNKRGSR